jgi:hypothetical protein
MLGKSLYCRARYQRSEGGFNWPPLPLEKAQLLRQQVHPLAPQQVTIYPLDKRERVAIRHSTCYAVCSCFCIRLN